MFFGKSGGATNDSQGNKIFDFGALTIKKKSGTDGSKVGTNADNVDLGTNTNGDTNGDTKIPGPGDIGYVGDIGQNPDIGPSGYVPLPDPDTFKPNSNTLPDPDIIKIDPVDEKKRRALCNDPNLPKDVVTIMCGPVGLEPNAQKTSVASFSLNAEEQAELDRLSRMFARLAPFLKTESDIASEKSNMEAYQGFTVEATRLARETDIERSTSYYKGPREIINPFLTNKEFGEKIGSQFELELLGHRAEVFRIKIWDLLGIRRDGLFGNKDEKKDKEDDDNSTKFMNNLADILSGKIVNTLDNYIGGTTTCPSGKIESCGSALFEKALKIY